MPTVKAATPYQMLANDLFSTGVVSAKMYQDNTFFKLSVFSFPFAPVEISYSNMTQRWNEIERPGDFPILDTAGPSLMKVQMKFRVADKQSNGIASCEPQLNQLRLMAIDSGPVWIVGMDTYLSRPVFPTVTAFGISLARLRITDMGVDIIRRNSNNQATQADVSLSLMEDRSPYIPAVQLPAIVYEDLVKRASEAAAAGSAAPSGGTTFTANLR